MNSAPSPSACSRASSAKGERSNTRRHDKPVPDFKALHRKNMRKLELAKKRDEAERERQRPKSAAPELFSTKRAEEKAQKKGILVECILKSESANLSRPCSKGKVIMPPGGSRGK